MSQRLARQHTRLKRLHKVAHTDERRHRWRLRAKRLRYGAEQITPERALGWATRGSARLLGRQAIGHELFGNGLGRGHAQRAAGRPGAWRSRQSGSAQPKPWPSA